MPTVFPIFVWIAIAYHILMVFLGAEITFRATTFGGELASFVATFFIISMALSTDALLKNRKNITFWPIFGIMWMTFFVLGIFFALKGNFAKFLSDTDDSDRWFRWFLWDEAHTVRGVVLCIIALVCAFYSLNLTHFSVKKNKKNKTPNNPKEYPNDSQNFIIRLLLSRFTRKPHDNDPPA